MLYRISCQNVSSEVEVAVQDDIKYQQILVKPKMRSLKVTFDDTIGEVHYWGYHQGSNSPHISGLIYSYSLDLRPVRAVHPLLQTQTQTSREVAERLLN